jgi:hypothetical protein
MTDKQKQQIEQNVGKRVKVFRSPDTNEFWFVPHTTRFNIQGVIDHVIWQCGDIPLYLIKFDEGFEGAFPTKANNLKIL